MILPLSSIPALSLSGNLRNVMPTRLSKVSQPTFLLQRSSRSRLMPGTL